MINVVVTSNSLSKSDADLVAVGIEEGREQPYSVLSGLDAATRKQFQTALKAEGFAGRRGQSVALPLPGGRTFRRALFVGLGKRLDAPSAARLVAVRAAEDTHATRVAVAFSEPTLNDVHAAAEGLVLGSYRFNHYKTEAKAHRGAPREGQICIGRQPKADERRAAERASSVARFVNLTRDLVNMPPNELTPTRLASEAKKVARAEHLTCRIFDKRQIARMNMNLLLAVNSGSYEPPRLIHLSYVPRQRSRATPRIVFVGKGITFDSGGLCIKPSTAMVDMKCDMAGAAATIAIMGAAARLKLPLEIHGIIPTTENMTGGAAFRPGDVYRSMGGKTVEIINTDAEGRLILADALTYAGRLKPDYIIDHATLTGACIVALGSWRGGLYTNDDALGAAYLEAAKHVGEAYWPMPLDDELKEGLRSEVADLKHTGDRNGGSITAALFLREFIGKAAWVHADIAGPAFQERPHGIHPRGATGFGVRTAIRFLESLTT